MYQWRTQSTMPYRRRRRSPIRGGSVIQSYKKVLDFAPTSRASAADVSVNMVVGVDSLAAGQLTPTDAQVPTGSRITEIVIQASFANLVTIASFVWLTIQHLRAGQAAVSPRTVGGNAQRNQVHLQLMRTLGQNQNRDFQIRFKIPKRFQRVREGDKWVLQTTGDTVRTDAYEIIYKFYR